MPGEGALEVVGQPIKRFFMGAPLAERIAPDLQALDAEPDPNQRARKLIDLRDKLLSEGWKPQDTYPVLHPRSVKIHDDVLRPGGAAPTTQSQQQADAVAHVLWGGNVPTEIAKPISPQLAEKYGAETGKARAGTLKDLTISDYYRGPRSGQAEAAAGASRALAGERGAKTVETQAGLKAQEAAVMRKALQGGAGSLTPEERTVFNKLTALPVMQSIFGSIGLPEGAAGGAAQVPGANQPAQPAVPQGAKPPPAPGTVQSGYRFKGGNPADPASWEPVQ